MEKTTEKEVQFSGKEIRGHFFGLMFFLVLLTVTTRFAFSFHNVYLYQLHSAIRKLFERDSLNTSKYNTVITDHDWRLYLENILNTYLHNVEHGKTINYYKTTRGHLDQPFESFWFENIIIGNPKLRQIRVAENTCLVHEIFTRYFNNCYTKYEPKYEYKNPTFKGVPYKTYEQYPAAPIRGTFSKYVGPGYVQFLTRNATNNSDILKDLFLKKWFDRGTRLVVFEIVFFNLNLNTFSNAQFFAERLASGTVIPAFKIKLLPVYFAWNDAMSTLILVCLLYAIVVYSLSSTIWVLITTGICSYIRSLWNLANLAYIATAFTSFFFVYQHMVGMDELINSLNNHTEEIFIEELCYVYDSLKVLVLFCAVFAWLMSFKFINFNRTMTQFKVALQTGYRDIFGFIVMFMIVFIAFSILGLLLFCKGNPSFSTFTESFITMMRMIMTHYQYDDLQKADNTMAPIFFIVFILFVFFVLRNTFLAVIGDSYVEARHHDLVGHSVFKSYLKNGVAKVLGFLKKKKELKKLQISELTPDKNAPSDMQNKISEDQLRSREHSLTERKKECSRLSEHVLKLEAETELLIEKMDRILQKLEIMSDEGTNDSLDSDV